MHHHDDIRIPTIFQPTTCFVMSSKKVKFSEEPTENESHKNTKNKKHKQRTDQNEDLAIVITWETWTIPQILALIGLVLIGVIVTLYQKDLKVRSFNYIEHINFALEFPNSTYIQQTILQLKADSTSAFSSTEKVENAKNKTSLLEKTTENMVSDAPKPVKIVT